MPINWSKIAVRVISCQLLPDEGASSSIRCPDWTSLWGSQASEKRGILPHGYGKVVISNYSDTHEDVVYDILDRKADVGAVKRTVVAPLVAETALPSGPTSAHCSKSGSGTFC